jgi:hypothetical protein
MKSLFCVAVFILCVIPHCCCGKQYKCVFGFSTGHVGTGTLSEQSAYKDVSHIEFLFEGFRMKQEANSKHRDFCRVAHDVYNAGEFSELDEESFVQTQLAPFFNRLTVNSNKRIIVDLGHANLFYYRGIAKYYLNPNKTWPFCNELEFVRIRRSRYEAAKSLMYRSPGHPRTNLCADVKYGYCPYKNSGSVILHPVSEEAWNKLDVYQQMLWLIDETEARWQLFKKKHADSGIRMTEIFWSSHGQSADRLDKSIPIIATILETEAAEDRLPQQHVHANISASDSRYGEPDLVELQNNAAAEKRYRAIMGF